MKGLESAQGFSEANGIQIGYRPEVCGDPILVNQVLIDVLSRGEISASLNFEGKVEQGSLSGMKFPISRL